MSGIFGGGKTIINQAAPVAAPAAPPPLPKLPIERLVSSPQRDVGSGTRDTIKTTPAGLTKRRKSDEEPLGPSEASSVYIPRLTAA